MVANATESLYSMINLDGVQECRPAAPDVPDALSRAVQPSPVDTCSELQSARKIATCGGLERAVTKVIAGNMSNCRFGRVKRSSCGCESARRHPERLQALSVSRVNGFAFLLVGHSACAALCQANPTRPHLFGCPDSVGLEELRQEGSSYAPY